MNHKVSLNKKKVIVVGNGMVGHHFIEQLNKANNSEFDIVTFSEETRLAYDRVMLTSYFTGNSANDLALTTPEEYDNKAVKYYINEEVTAINRDVKTLTTSKGQTLSYDKLVLATGSFPFIPPVPGKDQDHIHVYRTLEDLDAIELSASTSKVGVVIGGGLLGLEAANAIKQLGLETHVVEFAPRLMAVQLDQDGGDLLSEKITALGVSVHTEKNTTEIVSGDNCRYRMNFSDGTYIETDVIVFSAGIRPQDKLAMQCGLTLGERGGIVIDDFCLTNDKSIYAIGECALWNKRIFGLVAPGYSMAKAAVSHITNGDIKTLKPFKGADMSTKLKLLGVEVGSIGDAHGVSPDSQSYSFVDSVLGIYKKIVVSGDGKRLLGAVLVGDTSEYGQWLPLVLNKIELNKPPEHLLLPNIDDDDSLNVSELPADTQICACYDVSKNTLCEAIEQGANDVKSIQSCTEAGTGCGSCIPLLSELLALESEKISTNSVHNEITDESSLIFPSLPNISILPEHLILLGEIAKEFNLDINITTTQHIEFVGAKENQLPIIRQKMVNLGLMKESNLQEKLPSKNPELFV